MQTKQLMNTSLIVAFTGTPRTEAPFNNPSLRTLKQKIDNNISR